MRVKIVPIGNSRGIRIPKKLLDGESLPPTRWDRTEWEW